MRVILWCFLFPFLPVRWMYRLLRTRNDVNAIRRGRVLRRVGRRAYGKATGRLAAKIFG
jgi:hypothetical protein